ncbi:hypothetical protein ACFRCQ_18150 [Cytobacillus firmus]|uniref:hypothetical protein n=1 Tax=Cytobacillus firmus TaxID=1399 RepID=UPI00367AB21C
MKTKQAKELIQKARDLRASKTRFLLEVTTPLKQELRAIREDRMLSQVGKDEKIKALKEKATPQFMKMVHLRKQEYQSNLKKAKQLAEETISSNVVSIDDATRMKFMRDFSDMKFNIAILGADKAFDKVKDFAKNVPDAAYAQLLLDNFHEVAGFYSGENFTEVRKELLRTYNTVKEDFTPEEVSEAYEIIEEVDRSINNKMFTLIMPGDNPAVNGEYSSIAEVFTHEAARYYQDTDMYFRLRKEEPPVYEDPAEVEEEKEPEVKKSPEDIRYAERVKKMEELQKRIDAWDIRTDVLKERADALQTNLQKGDVE